MEAKKEDDNPMLTDDQINEIYLSILPSVAACVRSSGNLPRDEHFDFYSTFSHFRDVMEVEGDRAVELISRIYRHAGVRVLGLGNKSGREIEDQVDALVEANDQLAERLGCQFDELVGIRKTTAPELVTASIPNTGTPKPTVASWNKKKSSASSPSYRLLAARFVQRPQLKFDDPVDNSDNPFYPKLKDKPNSKIPLTQSLTITASSEESAYPAAPPNPYKYEIEHLKYPDSQLKKSVEEPVKPADPDENSWTFIDTPEALDKLIIDLAPVNEIAIDLEHHDYRSFQGFTCLMQLSTRDQDYIIDTLALRSQLNQLNVIFTDPSKIKVFHGAHMDIEWLQKDFSLYIVNMFDTYEASRVLNLNRHSLAYLLDRYCRVAVDKQFQLADWRIRPLPYDLLSYAQKDTHYLLYIYDCMKSDLLRSANEGDNLLRRVLNQSALTCRKVYAKPKLTNESHMKLYKRSQKAFNNRQLEALQRLYAWRYKLAQDEDESSGYILPNRIMLQVCEILPKETSGVLACCNPIPPLVQQNLHAIHSIVQEARQLTLSVSIPIRQQARKQNKEVTSFLSILHDSPADAMRSKPELAKPIEIEPLLVETPTLPVAKPTKAAQTQSNKSKFGEIKSLFTRLQQNYNPVPFVDLMRLEKQETPKTPVGKRSHEATTQFQTENPLSDDDELVDGIDEPKSKVTKTTEQDGPKPLRSHQKTKKFVAPNTNIKPFDYPKQDMSEFKPEFIKRQKRVKQKKVKNDFARTGSAPSINKTLTYKRI